MGINATLFLLEIIVGWLAQSTALIADSLDTRWPDLIIGLIIAAVVLRGARRILDDARKEEAILSGGCNDSCSSRHNSQKGEAETPSSGGDACTTTCSAGRE
ncbi:hypothetical protein [Sulfurivirga caldicuralii]|uniref:hypothetical protein n=1 Tax=Sulfurivirga caldicuralii TaxID=364032 RepID=UPI000940E0A3